MIDDSEPLVSVVLATNRDTPFLAEAVATLPSQTWRSWELVVVDNGVPDPDHLAAVVRDALGADHSERARVVHVPPPVTVSLARNVGVSACAGELLVFLDDDDVWHPDRLGRQVESLAGAPEAPAGYCGGWHMDAHGEPFEPSWPAVPATAEEMLARRARLPHIGGALMVRRDAFEAVGGFSPEIPLKQDMELMLRLLARGDFVCVPDELVGYRRHDHNRTSTSLSNVRLRRDSADAIISRHLTGALLRGDAEAAELLRAHLRAERSHAAAEAGGLTLSELADGRLRAAAGELAWGVRHDASSWFSGLVRRGTARFSAAGRARRRAPRGAPPRPRR